MKSKKTKDVKGLSEYEYWKKVLENNKTFQEELINYLHPIENDLLSQLRSYYIFKKRLSTIITKN